MTPEESKVLKDHLKAAAILLNNTPKEELREHLSLALSINTQEESEINKNKLTCPSK